MAPNDDDEDDDNDLEEALKEMDKTTKLPDDDSDLANQSESDSGLTEPDGADEDDSD